MNLTFKLKTNEILFQFWNIQYIDLSYFHKYGIRKYSQTQKMKFLLDMGDEESGKLMEILYRTWTQLQFN